MDSRLNYDSCLTTSTEQILYDHLLNCVETASPDEAISDFRKLFIDGTGYPDFEVWRSMGKCVSTGAADKEFKFILNRCCYILINRWLMQPRLHNYIPELIALFETVPAGLPRSRTSQRLRDLVQQFTLTEQYLVLNRLAKVIKQAGEERNSDNILLGNLIHRYPCLYEHTLLTEDSDREQRRRIRTLRVQAQRQFEIELSHYLTYRKLRRFETAIIGFDSELAGVQHEPQLIIKNPTLLSDRQLDCAVEFFTGRVDGYNTHRDLAMQFLAYSKATRCYRTFKEELYGYLITSIDPKYGQRQFNQNLYTYLQSILPENDYHKMNEVLLVTTCRKLLNFLVVESLHQPNHFVFSDLTANLGITTTIGLLLKIVLLCTKIRFYLEKRFSILFNHYESYLKESVNWLVEALENLNIALSTHFGSMSLCRC